MVRPIRPEEWLRFIARARFGERASESCAGWDIRPQRPSSICRGHIEETGATALPLSETSLVQRRLLGNRKLLWVVTHSMPNGDGLGPVALVSHAMTEEESQMNVEALGVLQARTGAIRLRLQRTNTHEILIAEGETCETAGEPRTCRRAARFMIRDDDRFVQAELHRAGGFEPVPVPIPEPDASVETPMPRGSDERECVGWATVELNRREQVDLPNEWRRDFRLSASVTLRRGAVLVHEQIDARDRDPRNPRTPSRPFRSTEADLRLVPMQTTLVTRDRSLWGRMLQESGAMTVAAD